MDVAMMMTVQLSFDDVPVTVPHPAAFALHKLLVAPRRRTVEKRRKDVDAALMVLALLEQKHETHLVKALFDKFPRPWRKRIVELLAAEDHGALAAQLVGH